MLRGAKRCQEVLGVLGARLARLIGLVRAPPARCRLPTIRLPALPPANGLIPSHLHPSIIPSRSHLIHPDPVPPTLSLPCHPSLIIPYHPLPSFTVLVRVWCWVVCVGCCFVRGCLFVVYSHSSYVSYTMLFFGIVMCVLGTARSPCVAPPPSACSALLTHQPQPPVHAFRHHHLLVARRSRSSHNPQSMRCATTNCL